MKIYILEKTQVEQVSVMNKLLNDALRAKGYAGPDIKMVLTDVTDPNGPYYTDTLTNVVVFDRKELAKSNRDQILNALGHEFGHYSKEDDIDKSQDIANHTGKLLEDRTKGMVSKEATEDTLARIRNNKNVITGEEGKQLAESIPMDRREYVKWGRVFRGTAITFLGGFRTFLGISEIGLGAASSSVGVGVLVVGHGVAQTGFGISDMGEGIHDIYLGFKDVDDEEQQAVRISKKVLGKYEEPLNFAVGATTDQAVVIGQAFYRFPRMGSMTGNTNSSTKKESNSNVTTEKQKTNNTGREKVVEDIATVKTVGSNNKNGSDSKNSQNTANLSKNVTSYSGDKIAGYNTADVKTMSVKDFRKLGEKLEETGHNGKARFLKGTDKEAREMFYARVVNVVEDMSNEKGTVLKGVDKYGNKVVYRGFSTRGGSYPTIDVYETINGDEKKVTELKFKE